MEMYNRKIREMENENNDMRNRLSSDGDSLQKAKMYAKEL